MEVETFLSPPPPNPLLPISAFSDLCPPPVGLSRETSFDVESLNASAAAAVKVQKVYRSYRTRRRLADTAVVAEELWWQALDYVRLERSTVSFFNFPETAASRWSRVGLNASKVGKGLSEDAKAQKLAFEHWIEAIDPRHRYGHNLHIYYDKWRTTNSGQPFFFWLDVGDGKDIDLEECPRSKLRKQLITYLGPQEREDYEYIIVQGKFIHKLSSDLLTTPEGVKWIFVMSTSRQLYAGQKKKGKFQHSSFLAGGATLAAGRFVVIDGILKSISAYSGHYRPTDDRLDTFLSFLEEKGVDLSQVQIERSNNYESYDEDKSGSVKVADSLSDGESPDAMKSEDSGVVEPQLAEIQTEYKRSLSGGLQSPRTEVPKEAILQRINSKKADSYELGHQLPRTWSSGAGPRLGCIADYPLELRFQALEFTELSPRHPPPPSSQCLSVSGFTPSSLSPSSQSFAPVYQA